MSLKFQKSRFPALLALLVALAQSAAPREARAGNLWDWLFPSRNHSYYAGPYGPPQGQGQIGTASPSGAPFAATGQQGWHVNAVGSTPTQSATMARYSPATAYSANPALASQPSASPYGTQPYPASQYPASQYPASQYPAQQYPANQYPANQHQYSGAPSHANQSTSGTMQQLTNPLVIIPASSAPIAGPSVNAPDNTQVNTAANSLANGSVSPQGSTIVGYPGYSPTGAPAGFGTTTMGTTMSATPSLVTTMMPGQTQQVFMMNQGAQLGSCATCLPGHSRSTSSYRTVWYRVPTTNVRPVAAVDPCTGLQTTVMRPCTTFSWQARRAPTMRSPSLCERLFSCFRRPPPPTFPMAPTAMTTNYVCGSGCGTMPAAGAATPYYSPPATTVPSGVAPAGGISPWGGTSLPATGYPSGAYPGGGTTSGGTTGGVPPFGTAPGGASPPLREPADVRPSLEPRRYAPQDFEYGGDQEESWPSQDHDRESGQEAAPDYDNAARRVPSVERPPPFRGPQLGGSNGSSVIRSSQETMDPRGKAPQPVPDPDAMLKTPQRFEPPQLLNPKDRRASQAVQRTGDYVLASWPDSPRATPRDIAVQSDSTVREIGKSDHSRLGNPVPRSRTPREASGERSSAGGPLTPPRTRPAAEIQPRGSAAPTHDSGWRSVAR